MMGIGIKRGEKRSVNEDKHAALSIWPNKLNLLRLKQTIKLDLDLFLSHNLLCQS